MIMLRFPLRLYNLEFDPMMGSLVCSHRCTHQTTNCLGTHTLVSKLADMHAAERIGVRMKVVDNHWNIQLHNCPYNLNRSPAQRVD